MPRRAFVGMMFLALFLGAFGPKKSDAQNTPSSAYPDETLNSFAFTLAFEFYLWDISFPDPKARQSLAQEIQTNCRALNLELKPPLEKVQEEKATETIENYLQNLAEALSDKPAKQQAFLLGCTAGRVYHLATPRSFLLVKVTPSHREELIGAIEVLKQKAQEVKLPQKFLTDLDDLKKKTNEVKNQLQLGSIEQGLFRWSREVSHYLASSSIRHRDPLKSLVSQTYTFLNLIWAVANDSRKTPP